MEQRYGITNRKKCQHLSMTERIKIEAFISDKKPVKEIARLLNRDRSTIYREMKRGSIARLHYDLSEKKVYRANVGQEEYERRGKNKERGLKIGKDHALAEYIRLRLVKDHYSPDAIIGQMRVCAMGFETQICTKTLYNYIDRGIFFGIGNETLWDKRKRKKHRYKKLRRSSYTNRTGLSIEARSQEIQAREEYGHWEGDTVKSKQHRLSGLLTLTERKSREQIIVKVPRATQEAIQEALDKLEQRYGDLFSIKFKSITFDNGVEFTNWKALQISTVVPAEKRTTVYFAHAYSAWERGTNENQNRMIRRFIPKGTDIAKVSEAEVQRIEDWMNNYPRKILGYRTSAQVAEENLQKTGMSFASVAL